jgi:predicted nucleic acid-binding protein
MICIDSDFIIDFFNRKSEAVTKMKAIENDTIAVTAISVFEVLYGLFKKDASKKAAIALEFFSSFQILATDLNAASKAAQIAAQLARDGRMINEFDSMIAGAMLTNGYKSIVTFNKKDFDKINELEVI